MAQTGRAPGTRLRFRLSEDATVLVEKGGGTVRRFQRGRKAGRVAGGPGVGFATGM